MSGCSLFWFTWYFVCTSVWLTGCYIFWWHHVNKCWQRHDREMGWTCISAKVALVSCKHPKSQVKGTSSRLINIEFFFSTCNFHLILLNATKYRDKFGKRFHRTRWIRYFGEEVQDSKDRSELQFMDRMSWKQSYHSGEFEPLKSCFFLFRHCCQFSSTI